VPGTDVVQMLQQLAEMIELHQPDEVLLLDLLVRFFGHRLSMADSQKARRKAQ
jgi:hypothetical protein